MKASIDQHDGSKAIEKTAKSTRQPRDVMARILTAATAAFTREGLNGARMRSIASEAGISIQLLIYHTKSKENLWQMVMEDILSKYSKFGKKMENYNKNATIKEKISNSIEEIVHYMSQNPQLYRIVTQESVQYSSGMSWIIDNFFSRYHADFTDMLAAGQREGVIRSDISPSRLRFAIAAMTTMPFLVAVEYKQFIGEDAFSPREIEKTIELIRQLIFIDE